MVKDVTGITVFCKNPNHVDFCLGSFHSFYPEVPLVVQDNSVDGECEQQLRSFGRTHENMILLVSGQNVGHGGGLKKCLDYVGTNYFLVFDSDVQFINPDLIPHMFQILSDGYGVGFTMWAYKSGGTAYPYSTTRPRPENSILYLHPFCALISVEQYLRFSPFQSVPIGHHNPSYGAPLINAMVDINDAGLEYELIKHLPNTAYTKCMYWNHISGGSRMIMRRLGLVP